MDETQPGQPEVIIVGIGSSAGGLEALTDLIAGLPEKTGLSYVVAQHLSPKHPSLMKELLARGTHLKVLELVDGEKPKPNTIYITPPGHDVEVCGNVLRCHSRSGVGPKPSVDLLFSSLAETMGDNSVGVVLSGTGSDGASGVRAIRAAGGVVLVQDPTQAKYDGMPSASIKTGCVDNILPAREIGTVLARLAPVISGATPIAAEAPQTAAEFYSQIVSATKRHQKFNLAHYKETTLYRRIARRMQVNRAATLGEYVELLETSPDEPKKLSRDLLISVTSFFRDPEHFEALKGHLSKLVESREGDDTIRIWITPCATGQEAYTLAIILWEILAKRRDRPSFKIFASDIDTEALSIARAGTYSEGGTSGLPVELREKYFERQESGWVARKFLRDCMVFAEQNLIEDPPFSRMDLISCRNLLIYFRPEAQKRALELLHYAMKSDGLLFLGKTESAELHTDLLEPVALEARIYRRARGSKSLPVGSSRSSRATELPQPTTRDPVDTERRTLRVTRPWDLTRALVSRYCPPALFVDSRNQVVHTAGDLSTLIKLPDGEVQLDVLQMLDASVRTEVRALLERVKRERVAVQGSRIRIREGSALAKLALYPIVHGTETLVMLAFEPVSRAQARKSGEEKPLVSLSQSELIGELERELGDLRIQLQHAVEQLETANEELQAQSEELQSSNEELQSTNEELQTSNEELQSTNEELSTVNDELNSKSENLDQIASIFVSVKDGLGSPLIVTDKGLHIKEFSQEAKLLIGDGAHMISGQSLSNLTWRFDASNTLQEVRQTIADGRTRTSRISCGTRHYLLAITQNRTSSGIVQGASLIFTDISEQVRAETAALAAAATLTEERDRIAVTLKSIGDGVITTDHRGHVTYMNPMASNLTGWLENDAIDHPITDVYRLVEGENPESNPVIACLQSGKTVTTRQANAVIVGRSGRRIQVMESAAPLRRSTKETYGVVLVFRDVSDERLLSQELHYRAKHDPLTGLINRYEFDRCLRNAFVATRTRREVEHVLMYLDLDNFKLVNDTSGHEAGDELLKSVAGAIRNCVRAKDIVARLGGDEFGILLMQCDVDHAKTVADKIRLSILELAGGRSFGVDVSACVGLSRISFDTESLADATSAADTACYMAKESGKNKVYMASVNDDRMRMRNEQSKIVPALQSALRKGELELYYEDVVSVLRPTEAPKYRELLVRMRGPDGLISPAHFLPAAERYQMMTYLDLEVFRKALAVIETHLAQKHDTPDCVWAVNVSGVSLSDAEYRQKVLVSLEQRPQLASRLCLEITESTAIRQMSEVVPFANKLRELGCSIALDDFGAGVSGFSYLKILPVNYLKIDGGLIRDIATDEVCRSMIRAITDVAGRMGITTIAEHVENAETLAALVGTGVDLAQGYHVGGRGNTGV